MHFYRICLRQLSSARRFFFTMPLCYERSQLVPMLSSLFDPCSWLNGKKMQTLVSHSSLTEALHRKNTHIYWKYEGKKRPVCVWLHLQRRHRCENACSYMHDRHYTLCIHAKPTEGLRVENEWNSLLHDTFRVSRWFEIHMKTIFI